MNDGIDANLLSATEAWDALAKFALGPAKRGEIMYLTCGPCACGARSASAFGMAVKQWWSG